MRQLVALLPVVILVGCAAPNRTPPSGGVLVLSTPSSKDEFQKLDDSLCLTLKAYTATRDFQINLYQPVLIASGGLVPVYYVISPAGSYIWHDDGSLDQSANGTIFKADHCTFFLDIKGTPVYAD